jgi:hypothetical protein
MPVFPMRAVAVLALLAALSACGQKADLKPVSGKEPPVPYGREESLSSKALLRTPTQAAPERSVELRTRSEEREDDPFDLPPGE